MYRASISALTTVLLATAFVPMQCHSAELPSGPRTLNAVEDLAPSALPEFRFAKPAGSTRPLTVVALAGGADKAVAEIGVLRSLEKHHVLIDGVIGTSMGATIGALYCAGIPLDQIEQMFLDGTINGAIKINMSARTLGHPLVRLAHIGHEPYAGLSSGKRLKRLYSQYLPPTFCGLKKPFVAVATDLNTGRPRLFASGDLRKALMASNAIPPLFEPVEIDGNVYIDGGVRANLPARLARKIGAEMVLAVLVDKATTVEPSKKFKKLKNVVARVTDIMLAEKDEQQMNYADVVIYPDADSIPIVTKKDNLLLRGVAAGEAAADAAMPVILQKLVAKTQEAPTTSAELGGME